MKIAIMATTLFLIAVSAYGQKPNPKPTLKETLVWIQDSLKQGDGDVKIQNSNGTEIRTLRLADFSGCRVHFVHTNTVAGKETLHDEDSFDLRDIDPEQVIFNSNGINSSGLFGAITQNEIKKIAKKDIFVRNTLIPVVEDSDSLFEAEFYSSYGKDFKEAFKLAVKMCGGKPSVFTKSSIADLDSEASPVAGGVGTQSALPRKDIPAIAKAANGAIVTIITAANDKPIAQGTGFLVSADGVIVTNYHVIETGNVAVVKFPDGTVLPVDGVLAADKVRDLAIIKIHGKTFRTLTLGDSDDIQVGEEVVAIGNPLGLELTVSNGILSGVRVTKEEGKFLQTTAPISPGSSGGPLFNMRGEVVGINTMYLEGGENLNFAIPVNDAKLLLRNQSSRLQDLPNEAEAEETPKESQQKGCDTQTQKYAHFGHISDVGIDTTAYANNYDVSTTRCYVMTISRSTNPSITEHYYLIKDASFFGGEGSKYGACALHKNGTVIDECHIWPRGKPGDPFDDRDTPGVLAIDCRSEVEFNEQALKYFGINAATAHVYSYDKDGNDATNEPDKSGSSPKSLTVDAPTTTAARNYYQQLFDAGAFSHGLPNRVCFSDDANSGTFFTITAYAYDENYYNAQAKLQPGPSVTPEESKQFKIMEAVQRTAPYVTFLMKGWLESFPPKAQQFFHGGGRILEENVYEKGVETNTLEYLWDVSSWFLSIPPIDPNAYTRTSKILHLSIEPTTMRYAESATVTLTVGNGDTAATDTSRHGPWTGVCEKVPNPKF
jgi:S1-C subfamily serine protease